MKAITYSYARQNLADTMENVCIDKTSVTITRKNGKSVVMMSQEEYDSLEETAYLLRSPKNMKRLIESISRLESGEGKEKELIEP